MNFALAQHHKWDIASLEDLPPFERDIYVELLAASMDKSNIAPDNDDLKTMFELKKEHQHDRGRLPSNDEINKALWKLKG